MVLNRSKELKSFVKCIPVIVISFAVVMLLVWGVVRKLFRRGYMNIIKNDTSIVFERWKRPFSYEFRAGFAFNFRGTDWVDVDFRINQQELEKDDWYYYEEDYNEYRITH